MVGSLDLCIEACASYNVQSSPSIRCDGVAYIPIWSSRNATRGENPSNCVLKSRMNGGSGPNPEFEVDSAVLESGP